MIGKIKGILTEIDGNVGLIETISGLSYQVFLMPEIITKTLPVDIELYTYLHVREDNWSLFGFNDKSQYKLFTLLLSVDKIGPKLGFTIVSYAGSETILQAITNQNVDFFSNIPGIGKKTAQKILFELSSKLGTSFSLGGVKLSEDDSLVIEALISLGFKRFEGVKALQSVTEKNLSVEEKIRQSLQFLGTAR